MASTFSNSDDDSFSDSDQDGSSFNEDLKTNDHNDDEVQASKPKLSKHLIQLQQKLGLDDMRIKLSNNKQEELKLANKPSTTKSEPLVVVYQDPRKRRKLRNSQSSTNNVSTQVETESTPFRTEEFNLIKAKHDVKKFTIKSLKKTSKEQANIALAVSLGALPPKPKSTNYKLLKQLKKKEILKQKKMKETENVLANKVSSLSKKKAPRRDKNKVVNFDSSFGKYGPKLKKQMKTGKSKKN